DYLREKELRLCLEDEEMLRCKHEKLIVEENRFRLYEAWRLRLEEENMLQLEEQKKNKRKEFMNSSHGKNSLAKLAPAMRNQLCSSSEKINSKLLLCSTPIAKKLALIYYANGERYTAPWSKVDQVFIPINETGEHWCLAQFHILSGEVTFYDTGYTYDYDYRDWLAHGLSLDVDDPVDVALAYREKIVSSSSLTNIFLSKVF
ncbi:phospholipase-like protein, partial [Tanacetum coccineum]